MNTISDIKGLSELVNRPELQKGGTASADGSFADTLKEAVVAVDDMQKVSEAAQQAYARNEQVDLHDVLIKVEEAEIAFKTMMEVRNKLVEAYREVMRMG